MVVVGPKASGFPSATSKQIFFLVFHISFWLKKLKRVGLSILDQYSFDIKWLFFLCEPNKMKLQNESFRAQLVSFCSLFFVFSEKFQKILNHV